MSAYTIRLLHKKPPMTSNGQRRAHWTAVRKAKREVHDDVFLRAKCELPAITAPVEVFVTWYAQDRRIRDSDACAPFLKAALDALVDAGVIPGDDHRYVSRSGSSVVVDRADPRMELEIREAGRFDEFVQATSHNPEGAEG